MSSLKSYWSRVGRYILVCLIVLVPSAYFTLTQSTASTTSTVVTQNATIQTLVGVATLLMFLSLISLAWKQVTGRPVGTLRDLYFDGTGSFVTYVIGFIGLLLMALLAPTIGWYRFLRWLWQYPYSFSRPTILTLRVIYAGLGGVLGVVIFGLNILLWLTTSVINQLGSQYPIYAAILPIMVVLPAIYVIARYSLLLTGIAARGQRPVAAFKATWHLTRRRVWRIVGAQLILALIVIIYAVAVIIPVYLLALVIHQTALLDSLYELILYIVAIPFVVIYQAQLYNGLLTDLTL